MNMPIRGIPVYSLWLNPQHFDSALFRQWISDLSARFRTNVFEPHITLLGELDAPLNKLLSVCETLSAQILPLRITLSEIELAEDFYRAIALKAEPDIALTKAWRTACGSLEKNPLLFRPHLSLLYGTADAEGKVEAAASLQANLPLQARFDTLSVVRTEGDMSNWSIIKKYNSPMSSLN